MRSVAALLLATGQSLGVDLAEQLLMQFQRFLGFAFAQQLDWPINGQMTKITADDWKDILTCAFRNEQPRVAMGLSGGMVLLGQRTSKFGKREFSEWLEFLWATANERGVVVYQEDAA